MERSFTNIYEDEFEEGNARGERWWSLDLSGEHLGVRVEEILPGGTSSNHHYHTTEEEHVIALSGTATLHLGAEEHDLKAGDHVCFAAGDPTAHHIENRTSENFKFLVFGERKQGDVVVYPNDSVVLIKALGWKQFSYEARPTAGESGEE